MPFNPLSLFLSKLNFIKKYWIVRCSYLSFTPQNTYNKIHRISIACKCSYNRHNLLPHRYPVSLRMLKFRNNLNALTITTIHNILFMYIEAFPNHRSNACNCFNSDFCLLQFRKWENIYVCMYMYVCRQLYERKYLLFKLGV
jgi:hypothetical protein